MNWYDAVEYAEWLAAQTGQVYRLPTEAEWEYAARAGTETAFWWGDSIATDQANYGGNHNATVPVDWFQPNPWGLYQVHGNVWEWTGSRYKADYSGAEMRCAGENESGPLALRGGSWLDQPAWVRSVFRYRDAPTVRFSLVGFRLARSL